MASNKDYDKFKFLKTPSFVIASLDTNLSVKKSKHESRVFSIIMAATAITVFLILVSLTTVMNLTGAHPLIIVIAYSLVAFLITWRIIAKVQYHIDDTIRERTTGGDGNIKFDLVSAWRITPGGIQENVDVGNGGDKGTVLVTYDTKAIFLKGIMRGTSDLKDGDDLNHYNTMQQLYDIAFKNGFEVIEINVPHDTDNDPIWDVETGRIHRAAGLGKEYLKFRTQLHDIVYNFTKRNSTVTVTYFILKATASARVQPDIMGMEITQLKQQCIMDISGVSMAEMKNLMESYYGVTISIEDILSFMTVTSSSLGECKLISYALEDGTVIEESSMFKYIIQENIGMNEIIGDYMHSADEDNRNSFRTPVSATLEGDIFSKDYI